MCSSRNIRLISLFQNQISFIGLTPSLYKASFRQRVFLAVFCRHFLYSYSYWIIYFSKFGPSNSNISVIWCCASHLESLHLNFFDPQKYFNSFLATLKKHWFIAMRAYTKTRHGQTAALEHCCDSEINAKIIKTCPFFLSWSIKNDHRRINKAPKNFLLRRNFPFEALNKKKISNLAREQKSLATPDIDSLSLSHTPTPTQTHTNTHT